MNCGTLSTKPFCLDCGMDDAVCTCLGRVDRANWSERERWFSLPSTLRDPTLPFIGPCRWFAPHGERVFSRFNYALRFLFGVKWKVAGSPYVVTWALERWRRR